MTKKRKHYKISRLARIEHKCNIIISELLILRQRNTKQSSALDRTIDQLHSGARRLRQQCETEQKVVAGIFHTL